MNQFVTQISLQEKIAELERRIVAIENQLRKRHESDWSWKSILDEIVIPLVLLHIAITKTLWIDGQRIGVIREVEEK